MAIGAEEVGIAIGAGAGFGMEELAEEEEEEEVELELVEGRIVSPWALEKEVESVVPPIPIPPLPVDGPVKTVGLDMVSKPNLDLWDLKRESER